MTPQRLQAVSLPQAHYGPDKLGYWYAGPLGMVHQAHHTTPESIREQQPLAQAGFVVTADVRLDNRAELIHTLRAPESATDVELVLAAYRQWGVACVEYLIGAFALAVWDERAQTLFCARDVVGMRPLYYHHHEGRLFACATTVDALLAIPDVPHTLDDIAIMDYLVATLHTTHEIERTFYSAIRRLPAGHALLIGRDSLRLWRYHEWDNVQEVVFADDDRYAQAFLEHFEQAVQAQLRTAHPLGLELSGGLDSSSIVTTARRLDSRPLHTFYSLPQDPQADERAFVQAILETDAFNHHEVPRVGLFTGLESTHTLPYTLPLPVAAPLAQSAQAQGVRVLLNGSDGDTVVSHGVGGLEEMLWRGDWDAFLAQAEHEPHRGLIYVYDTLQQMAYRHEWGKLVQRVWEFGPRFRRSRWKLFRQQVLRPVLNKPIGRTWRTLSRFSGHRPNWQLFNPAVSARLVKHYHTEAWLDEGLRRLPNTLIASERHRHDVAFVGHQIFYEELVRFLSAYGIEPRSPFYDLRLIRFCLGLPHEQKRRHGLNRHILRHAMRGSLPDEVRLRVDKVNFQADLHQQMDTALIEHVLHQGDSPLAEYVDPQAHRALYERWRTLNPNTEAGAMATYALHRTVSLGLWLNAGSF